MKEQLPYQKTSEAIKGYCDSEIAKNETNDCVVRAFASAFDVTYDFAHQYVEKHFQRQPGKGTFGTSYKMITMSNNGVEINGKNIYLVGDKISDFMWGALRYDAKLKGQKIKREMTVGRFIKENPKGTFFVIVRGHAFTIKNGVVIGNVEDSKRKRKVMHYAFKIE